MKNKKLLVVLAISAVFIATTAFAQVYPEGIVASWNFDEGSGSTAYDSVGNNDGTIVGATWIDGKCGTGLMFDGDDYVSTAFKAPIGAKTIEFWMKTSEYPPPEATIISHVGAINHYGFVTKVMEYSDPGKLYAYVFGGSSDQASGFISNSSVVTGEWIHVAFVWDGTTDSNAMKLYLDGVLDIQGTPYSVETVSPTYNMQIGRHGGGPNPDYPYIGYLDEVRVYNKALTEQGVQQLYQNGIACDVISVSIDIKPGSDPNCFNNDGHGVIPVAILSECPFGFDATEVDPSTVELAGLTVRAVGKANKLQAHIEDVNGDGCDDLVVQIEDIDGTFTPGQDTATLVGNLFDDTPFEGTDSICIVP